MPVADDGSVKHDTEPEADSDEDSSSDDSLSSEDDGLGWGRVAAAKIGESATMIFAVFRADGGPIHNTVWTLLRLTKTLGNALPEWLLAKERKYRLGRRRGLVHPAMAEEDDYVFHGYRVFCCATAEYQTYGGLVVEPVLLYD
jgi:hypothetical protein